MNEPKLRKRIEALLKRGNEKALAEAERLLEILKGGAKPMKPHDDPSPPVIRQQPKQKKKGEKKW